MSDIVEIIIRTIDESSGATGNIVGSFTEMQSAIGLAKQGIEMIKGAYDNTVGSVVSYDDSIRSVAAATGMSTEQTSKMIDLTDNFGISTGALTMAQKTLAREGYSLNIDTLKMLGNEYTNLGTQAEKTTFLVKNFGRSGMDFATMFDYGTAAMDKFYNGSADGMVRTKEQIRSTLELTIAQKDLGDAWQGLVNKTATPIIPQATNYIKTATEELTAFTSGSAADAIGFIGHQYQIAFGLISGGAGKAAESVNSATSSMSKLYTVTAPTTEQLAAQAQGYTDQINLTMQIAQQTDAFAASQDNLNKKISETQAEIQKARSQGYAPWGKHMTELAGQLDQLQKQQDDNLAANAENTKKQVFNDYLKMNSNKEMNAALYTQEQAVGVALGITTDAEAKKATRIYELNKQMSDGKISAEAYARAVSGIDVKGFGEATPASAQDAAAAWKQAHPDAAANQTASQSQGGTGTAQAAADAWKKTQETIQSTAKSVVSAAAGEFSSYSQVVTKQADIASDSVKNLFNTLSSLNKFSSFTITVTGNAGVGSSSSAPEYP